MARLFAALTSPAARGPLLSFLGALLLGASLTIALVDTDGDHTPDTVRVTVNAAPNDGAPAKVITVPTPVADAVADQTEAGLRDETPEGAPADQLAAAQRAEGEQAAADQLVEGGAAITQRGCRTRFVGNQSSRNGVRPKGVVLHYTVGPNLPGELDLNALDALADRASSGVSWTYAIDRDGNCHYNVPEDRKPWTNAAANPFYLTVEVVNTGAERSYMDEAGYRKLALVIHDAAERWGFPIAKGTVSGCVPTRPGIIDHSMLGLCGGGHHDITPYSLDDVVAKIQRYAAQLDAPSLLTAVERRITAAVKRPAGTGHSRRYWCSRSAAQRAVIRSRARAERRGWDREHRGQRYQLLAKLDKATCR